MDRLPTPRDIVWQADVNRQKPRHNRPWLFRASCQPLMATLAPILSYVPFLSVDMRDRVESQSRMSVSAPRAHFRGDPDSFHDLLGRRPMPHRCTGMAADAIRALRHMGDRNRDQLLCLCRNRTFSEDAL